MVEPLVQAIASFVEDTSKGNVYIAVLLLSGYAALMTSLGGLMIVLSKFFSGRVTFDKFLDLGMGFSSGVMIVASFTSLLLPAIELSRIVLVIVSFLVGAVTIHVLNRLIPHEHIIKGYEGPETLKRKIKAAWLVATAIILHNLPEGMSIGASASYSLSEGIAVALAIGTQDFPEGLAVSMPVYAVTGGLMVAIGIAVLSGLSEVLAAITVALFLGFNPNLLGAALAFAAGAMVYVVSYEALPESHRSGHEDLATIGFFAGFIIMMYLDVTLG